MHSSRKYRPQTFQEIVGQKAVVTTLQNAIALRKVATAYLFCGAKGTGKTTLARLFAKALNCKCLSEKIEPCNTCSSCLDITGGSSFDVLEIDGASNRGIDDIRGINETVCFASSSPYKIYIIDEVHMLTKEAFNALLKTLEEPPPGVLFLFATTEPHKVLPTIVSRCQRFDLQRIPHALIIQKLQKISTDSGIAIEEEAFSLIAHLSEGALRDAESLLDQLACYANGVITHAAVVAALGLAPKSLFFRLDRAIQEEKIAFAMEMGEELFSSGKEPSFFFDGLVEHFRTHLLLKLRLALPALSEEDRRQYHELSSLYTEDDCLYVLDFLLQWQKELPKLSFKRMLLEMLLLHLIRSKNRVSIAQIVQKLGQVTPEAAPPKPVEVVAPKPTEPVVVAEPLKPVIQKPVEPATPPAQARPLHHYDTLLRFAAVELEGTLKKE